MLSDPSSTSFLPALSVQEHEELRSLGHRRHINAGAVLFHEQDPSDFIVLVERGRVKVSASTAQGREVLLGVRGPGEILGELSAIDGQPRSATVSAIEPVDAWVVSGSDFLGFLRANPHAAIVLLALVVSRLRDADRKRIEFGAYAVKGRIAQRLVELAEAFGTARGDGIFIAVPMSQQELAAWTSSSREMVARTLRSLRERKVVTTHRRGITIHDLDALRRLVR